MTWRFVLWVAMVLALAGAVPGVARADWDDRPDPSEFEEELAPHGYWADDPGFGHVWRPYVGWDWRPYVDGHWIWTSYGWTWADDEPWGWTFHYGRWGFSSLYGWVWTPGYVWGPAWVDWYWGDGYVGWVPLGPAGFAIVPSYWTYVRDYSFCSPRVRDAFIVHDRLPRYIVHHREQGWGVRHAPDFRDIEHVSRHRIVRENDRPRDSVAPWVKHRIERGERVRERIAARGGERVIEHAGRGPERGGRGPERAERRDDGWRKPGGRDPHAVERRQGDERNPDVLLHGRATRDDRPAGDDDRERIRRRYDGRDDRPPRRADDGDMAPRPRDQGHTFMRQPGLERDDRARPEPRGRMTIDRGEQPGAVRGGRGGGGGDRPMFVERGRGGAGPGGGAGGGGTMRHGQGGGERSAGGDHPGGGGRPGGGGHPGGGGGRGGGGPDHQAR